MGILICLWGCEHTKEKVDNTLTGGMHAPIVSDVFDPQQSNRFHDATTVVDTNAPEVLPAAPPKESENSHTNDIIDNKDDDLIVADTYWKLNWARKELRRGSLPYNLLKEMNFASKRLERLKPDKNTQLAANAIAHFKKGLEHLTCLLMLRQANLDDKAIPWGAGSVAMKQLFSRAASDTAASGVAGSNLSLSLSSRSSSSSLSAEDSDDEMEDSHSVGIKQMPKRIPSPSPTHQLAEALALDYETHYQTSPREMMRREWEQAIRQTNLLRDELHLQDRPENNDGDSCDVSTAIETAPFSYIDTPMDAGKRGVAPKEVRGY